MALSSACWRSLGLLARMAATRLFINVPSSLAASSGSSCSKKWYLSSILSSRDGMALCLRCRGQFPSVPPTARFTEVGLVGDSRHDRSSLERLERLPPKVLRPMHLPGLPSCGLSLDAAWP